MINQLAASSQPSLLGELMKRKLRSTIKSPKTGKKEFQPPFKAPSFLKGMNQWKD